MRVFDVLDRAGASRNGDRFRALFDGSLCEFSSASEADLALCGMLAFWTGGQFYIDQTYTLLVIAGIWALMQGVVDIVRAFQIRKLDQLV